VVGGVLSSYIELASLLTSQKGNVPPLGKAIYLQTPDAKDLDDQAILPDRFFCRCTSKSRG
jgi:hypothetical protein